jgi:hypothetical protein
MTNRHYLTGHLLMALMTFALAGCSQQPTVPEPEDTVQAMPFNIVSTGDSRVDVSAATTFSWAANVPVSTDTNGIDNTQLQDLLRAAINNTMTEKGYRPASAGTQGDLQVGYVLTLKDNDRTAMDIADSYGVHASITVPTPDPTRYEKGTLIIDILDSSTGLMAWRSALQGFASFQISEEQRRQRINEMVQRMLSGLPVSNAGR